VPKKEYYLAKRGDVWYVKFRHPVTDEILTARSTGQTNKTLADKWARLELPKIVNPNISIGEWLASFYTDDCPHISRITMEGRPYSPRTKAGNRRLLETYILTDLLCRHKLADLKRADVLAFRERLVKITGRSRTAQMVMSVFKATIREALFRDYIAVDPFRGVGQIAYTAKIRTALDAKQLEALLLKDSYKNPVFWRATMCAALTGMRAGEIRALQWGDLVQGLILIRRSIPVDGGTATLPKWGKIRTCPYPKTLAQILEPLRGEPSDWVFSISGGPLGYKHWSAAVRQAGAGIPGVCLHALRHTLNTRLRESGVPDEILRGSFGWSAPDIHDNYTHRDRYDYSGQAAAIDSLFGGSE
jgi:integrase